MTKYIPTVHMYGMCFKQICNAQTVTVKGTEGATLDINRQSFSSMSK